MKKNKIIAKIILNKKDNSYHINVCDKKLLPFKNKSLFLKWKSERELKDINRLMYNISFYYNGTNKPNTLSELATQSHFLSLKDDYWICSDEDLKNGLSWKDINFFDKNFGFGFNAWCTSLLSSIGKPSTKYLEYAESNNPDSTMSLNKTYFYTKCDDKIYLNTKFINDEYYICLRTILDQLRNKRNIDLPYLEFRHNNDSKFGSIYHTEIFTNKDISYSEILFNIPQNKKDMSLETVNRIFKNVKYFNEYIDVILLCGFMLDLYVDWRNIGFLKNNKNQIVSIAPIMYFDESVNMQFEQPFECNINNIYKHFKNIEWFDINDFRDSIIEKIGDNNYIKQKIDAYKLLV